MKKSYWTNKSVLITGYEGFLGSNLTKALIKSGARIVGIDIFTQRKKTIFVSEDIKRIRSVQGNVANMRLIKQIIRDNKIEYIFHLAAEAIVGRCYKDPVRTFRSNINGTWNVLEAARCSGAVRSLVVASSDKAYGIKSKLPYVEDASLAGTHPYDVSKSCTDLVSYSYFKTYGLPVSVTRCGNIYGPGDFNFSRIVPDSIRSILKGKTLNIRSDGKFTRDYIYVEDVVNAYLLLAEKIDRLKLQGEAFNFSNENPISVLELVRKIYTAAGMEPRYRILNQAINEIPHQYLSSRKAAEILGWKPRYNLDSGLKKTIQWYKEHLST